MKHINDDNEGEDEMRKLFCKKNYLAIVSFLLIFLLAAAPLDANAAQAGADASIRVKQTFTYDAAQTKPEDTFQYVLHPQDASDPMPEGTAADGDYTFAVSGTTEVNLPSIHFERTGIYTYEISQLIPEEKGNYTYDTEKFTVQVVVKNAENGGLTAELWLPLNAAGQKEEAISFANSYTAPVTPGGEDQKPDQIKKPDSKKDTGKTTSTGKTNPGQTHRVKTGDTGETAIWTMTAALALGAVFILVIRRKRQEEEASCEQK